jgi:hypothetical protein
VEKRNDAEDRGSRKEPPPTLEPDASAPSGKGFRVRDSSPNSRSRYASAITIDGDVREVASERREIDILYFGLSRAWFCDRSGSYGGIGKVTDKGWEWVDDNRVAAEVRKTIDVHRRDLPPELVELPFPAAE